MTVDELLKLIPAKTLKDLALETSVDHQVKKLSGDVVFKLILFSIINCDKLSLRVMESFISSAKFKSFLSDDNFETKYNSIRDRICTINVDYFEKLFNTIFEVYHRQLKEEKSISKADSTYVSIAASLFSEGILNGTKSYGKRHVKYSVNLKGSLPCSIKVYTDQSHVSEDLALGDLLDQTKSKEGNIVVFDRGLQSRKVFDKLSDQSKLFIGRANPRTQIILHKKIKIKAKPKNSTVTILSDEIGGLFAKHDKTQNIFRVIKGVINETGEEICFVTNMLKENAYTIADLYRERWEIEVFFKFLKQHLNLTHLVSRNLNGIKVMLYMTMIAAILIITYKKLNKISSFKIAKLKFEIELDNAIIKEIVILCGGNPKKASNLWNTS